MFTIFTKLADFIVYNILNLSPDSHFAHSLHFFIEDITKIFFLLIVMIYSISFLRASLNIEAIRDFLKGRKKISGYLIGSSFGAITPFCSCSSIPLFLGFTTAKIPVGITMAFLITSPMINEVAIILLGSIIGWKFTLIYVVTGIAAGITGGFIIDKLKAERYLQPFLRGANFDTHDDDGGDLKLEKLSFKQRRDFAKKETKDIVSRIWKWIIIGVGAGALLHGFVPDSWISENFGSGQWWTVPSAVGLGIPLYSNASGMVPIAESLLLKGLPVGTTIALMMSTVAASFPEFIMLKQVMEWKLLAIFFTILVSFFTIAGWLFNVIWPGSLILQ